MTIADSIRGALKSISRAVPDAVYTMTHGEHTGDAIRCSSNDIGADAASESAPTEKRRVIVSSADFPLLTAGCFVTIGDDAYLTTSATQDPIAATTKVGLSDSLDSLFVAYTGTRRVDGVVRHINLGIGLLGVAREKMTSFGESIAPINTQEWYLVVPKDAWTETSSPEDADQVEFYKDRQYRLKVADVTEHEGYWILLCRRRG